MRKIISFMISAMMVIALVCIVPVKAEEATKSLDNNAPTQQDISNYLKEHKDEISTDYKDTYTTAYTKREDASSYGVSDMGTLASTSQEKGLARLNAMRYIAGLDSVTLDAEYEKEAQASAYVNYLNSKMAHQPSQPSGASDELYNLAKLGSGHGNLTCNYYETEEATTDANLAKSVNMWLSDSDEKNIVNVGHRRWCLNPRMGRTGFGRAGGKRVTPYKDLNYDVHSTAYAHDLSHAVNQTEVAWPAQNMPAGYFANSDAWSYTSANALDFSDVKVTLTLKKSYASTTDKTWSMTTTSSDDGVVYVVDEASNSEGYDTVIFAPKNISIYAGDVYNVKITGIGKTVDYDVNFFLPEETTKFELNSSKLDSDGELVLGEGAKDYDLSEVVKFTPDSASNQYIKATSSNEDVAAVSNMKITPKAAGETTLTLEIMNGQKLTLPVKILAKTVNVPANAVLTYNGKEQNLFGASGAGVELYSGDDSAIDVGRYSCWVGLKDGFTWSDGSTATYRSFTWLIVKADNEIENFDVTNAVYPNKPTINVKLKFKDEDKTVEYKKRGASDSTYSTEVPVAPGNYVARVTADADNNVNSFKKIKNFTISKGSIDPDQVKMGDQSVTYDGKNHSGDVKVEDDNGDYSCSYTIKNSEGETVDQAVDAGTYEVTAEINAKENSDYYNSTSKIATLIINPAKVSLPKMTTEFPYDGKEHSICEETDTIKVENGTATKAGMHTATLSLKDKNHTWEDGTTDPIKKEFTIIPQKITLPEFKKEMTYNGEEQSIYDDEIPGVNIEIGKATDAGIYVATLTLKDPDSTTFDDGTTAPKTVEFTIKRKKIDLPELTLEMTYNGKEQAICDEVEGLEIKNRTATNAGSYTATFALDKNHAWKDGSTEPQDKDYVIKSKKITLPDMKTEFTYNGKEQSICDEDDAKAAGIQIENGLAIDAGEYKATVSVVDSKNTVLSNGKTSESVKYKINKEEITLPDMKTEFTYNGKEQSICDEDDAKAAGIQIENGSATDAGEYEATVSLLDSKNTMFSDGSTESKPFKFTIHGKKISFSDFSKKLTTELTYNGKEQSICDDADAKAAGVTIKNGKATKAGHYNALIDVDDNHMWDDGSTDSQSEEYEIKKKQITLPEMKTDLTYNGKEQSICDEIDGVDMTGEKATKAGDYEATFTVKDPENTEFSDGKTSKSVKYTIKKKQITLPEMKTSFTYNGNEQSICDEVEGLTIENRTAKEVGTYTATFTLKDNYIWDDGSTDQKTVTYEITKAANVTPTVPDTDDSKKSETPSTPSNGSTDTSTKPTNPTNGSTDTSTNPSGDSTNTSTNPSGDSTNTSTNPSNGSNGSADKSTDSSDDSTDKSKKLTNPSDQTNKKSNTSSTKAVFNKNVQKVTKSITALKNDRDIAKSSFGKIQLRASKITKSSITIKWKKVKGASNYMIYANKCGKKYRLIAQSKKASYTQKKLKKGTYYKYLVIAVNAQGKQVAASKLIHVATKGSKYGNVKSIKVNKTRVKLKKKKQFKLKIKVVKDNKKMQTHRGITYESSNTKVATVNKKGTIKAKAKGKATIYIYAQNGYFKTVSVTVK